MNGSVEIVIQKGENTAQVNNISGETKVKPEEQGKPTIQQGAVNTAIINAGKQVMMNGIRQYGNITGDYMLMEAFDNTLSIGADLMMIAKGGVIGALAVGTRYAVNIANSFIQQNISYKNIDLMQRRAGDIANNGSR